MKKKIFTIAITTIATLGFMFLLGKVGYWENHYITNAKIITIENTDITIEDEKGNLWTFYTDGDFTIGEEIVVTMFNNHTNLIIEDDEIEAIKK